MMEKLNRQELKENDVVVSKNYKFLKEAYLGETLTITIRTYGDKIIFRAKVKLTDNKAIDSLFGYLKEKFNIFDRKRVMKAKDDDISWFEFYE